jgi:signal transduction histidine kinase
MSLTGSAIPLRTGSEIHVQFEPPARFRRGALRAVTIAFGGVALIWIFVAGLRVLPIGGTPADSGVIALYCAVWIVAGVLAVRAVTRASAWRRRLREAEDAAHQADRLAQSIAALAAARTPAAAVEAALLEPAQALEADAGALILVDSGGRLGDVAHAIGYGSEPPPMLGAIAAGRRLPAADAVGRGAAVFVESPEARAAEFDRTEGRFRATAAVPLLIGSRVVAVMQLDFADPREFSVADRDYLGAIAHRAAQALDRTWQLDAALAARDEADAMRTRVAQELEERQRVDQALRASETRYRALAARTSRLHWFAAALSQAATLEAVARAVVEHGRNVLGAASGEVAMLIDDGSVLETIYSDVPASSGPGARYGAHSGLCETAAVAQREPVLVGSFAEWQDRYPRSAALAADGGYVSSATLPLIVEGEVAGVAAFHFTAPVNFDDEYRALLASVAQHCAQAVHRARLYEDAQLARAEAESANRQKDEFVSILSHDLRAPLNAILGWTSILQQGTLDTTGAERALQSIADNARRQQHLVEELLDFSRIRSGRLTLAMEDIDVRSLLRAVVESNIPVAAARDQVLDVSPVPSLVVRGDRRRLEQVFFNLIGNALKFTPDGGRIEIGARAVEGAAEIRVTDSGAGIPMEFLPHVFDAFRQADQTRGSSGGVGLGLSIARELVEAHGGSIRAESDGPGRGATFTVTLALGRAGVQEASTVH